MTAWVDISVMGPPGCWGRNSGGEVGPWDWMMMARSLRGRQWKGLVGPKRATCGAAERAGEVHGGGIDGEDEARAAGEGGEGEEIEPPAEIAPPEGGADFLDGGEVTLLMAIGAAGEYAGHLQIGLAPLDDLGPALGGQYFSGRAVPGWTRM
jgi:hypothetical protein